MITKLPIPSLLRTALVVSGLLTASACNDAPPATSGGSSESGDPSTSSGPSVPPSSSSGLDSTSTDPSSSSSGSGSTDTGSSSGSSGSTGSTGSTGSEASSDSGTTGTGSSSSSDGSSDSGTTGGGTGFCTYACAVAADCVPAGGDPADWSCNAGFCEFVGMIPPCDPAGCNAAAGLMCALVDGVDQCVIPCTPVGNECDAFDFECTGMTDMGDSICEPPPCGGALEGEPCFIQGFGQLGTCTDGLCTCTDDTECTAPDLVCNA